MAVSRTAKFMAKDWVTADSRLIIDFSTPIQHRLRSKSSCASLDNVPRAIRICLESMEMRKGFGSMLILSQVVLYVTLVKVSLPS